MENKIKDIISQQNNQIAKLFGVSIRTIQRKRKSNTLEMYIATRLSDNINIVLRQTKNMCDTKATNDTTLLRQLHDKIATQEKEIQELKTLVKAILDVVNSDKIATQSRQNSDILGDNCRDKEGDLGGVKQDSLIDSISLDSKQDSSIYSDSIKESSNTESLIIDPYSDTTKKTTGDKTSNIQKAKPTTKRKSVKELVELKLIDPSEVQIFKTYIFDRYPKTGKIVSRFDDSLKAFSELSQEEKQDLLDNMDNILDFCRNLDNPKYVTNLVGFLQTRKWETLNFDFKGNKKGMSIGEELMNRWSHERERYGI